MSTKYQVQINDIHGKEIGTVDVYSILNAYEVNNPAIAHAIKKLLMPGRRGVKTCKQDVWEAVDSLNRALVDIK